MPDASPELKRLRLRTGIKIGQWAQRVQMHRTAYSNLENGHRPGSPEAFARCAIALTELLGEPVEAGDLMEAGDDRPGVRRSTQARPSAEATETPETSEAATATEASVRRSA